MQPGIEALIHDAAALHNLIRFLKVHCAEQEKRHSYLAASTCFFEYVKQLGDACLLDLQRIVDQASASALPQTYHQRLVLLKSCWALLHDLIKPATDANTLMVPGPLLNLLGSESSGLSAGSPTKLVTLVAGQLNYYQYPHGDLKQLADVLKDLVPGAPSLPEGMGFIGTPYSYGGGLFANVLLYHEVGHFLFQDLNKASELDVKIINALSDPIFRGPNLTLSWFRDRLHFWAEETFCDLFAVLLAGPSFCFAAVDLFNLLGLLEPSASARFALEHPADAFRFAIQKKTLESHGWWGVIESIKSEHVKVIAELAATPVAQYRYRDWDDAVSEKLIAAFLAVVPDVEAIAASTTKGHTADVSLFQECKEGIYRYLRQGVVPSTLVINGKRLVPSPIALINASYCFYLEAIADLVNSVEGYQSDNIRQRSDVAVKLEMWAMKALEDQVLLTS